MLGYGADWPLDWREIVELLPKGRAGFVNFRACNLSVGPQAPPLPLSRHPVNAAGMILAKGAEAMGMAWTAYPPRHGVRPAWLSHRPASTGAFAVSAARPTPSKAR